MTVAPLPVPGPRRTSLPGVRISRNFLHFLRDPIAYMQMLHTTYGDIAGMTAGTDVGIFVFGATYNRQVLTNTDLFANSSLLVFPTPESSAARRLDAGLLTMNGSQHQTQRRLIQPAFHKQHIVQYHDAMVAVTAQMLQRWRLGGQYDIAQEMRDVTRGIVSQTVFGLAATDATDDLGGMMEHWLRVLTSASVVGFPIDAPGLPYRRALRHAERVEARLRALIAEKRGSPRTHTDVLATLIAARDEEGAGMTDTELIGQASILFSAGHETSANALTWTLFLLDQHPQVRNDVLDELTGVLHGTAPQVEHLHALPLLDRVIKESLRLLPPAVLGNRTTTAPTMIGPYAFPSGLRVSFSPYITHRDPTVYPSPLAFRPERWEQLSPSPYAYVPFGGGPRMCIGAAFALMEIKIVLAMVLQQYVPVLQPRARIDRQVKITLSPKHGMPMTLFPAGHHAAKGAVRGNIHEMVELPVNHKSGRTSVRDW